MPNIAKWTVAIIAAVTLILITWDVYVAVNSVDNAIDTISGRMKIWGQQSAFIPWVWGGLGGHFFGPFVHGQFIPQKVSMTILIFLTWLLIVLNIYLKSKGINIPPWITCALGFFAFSILWAQ